ncbi:MAG: hypothetical protein EAZ36_03630 [Verrucomicrobia bacterium]|nr:MAG: hypothetical protein EAZ36_03630 [Verrucomicrobiota bacterium]
MNSPITSSAVPSALIPAPTLIDIVALRTCGIFPANNEPSIRTLREWTRRSRSDNAARRVKEALDSSREPLTSGQGV